MLSRFCAHCSRITSYSDVYLARRLVQWIGGMEATGHERGTRSREQNGPEQAKTAVLNSLTRRTPCEGIVIPSMNSLTSEGLLILARRPEPSARSELQAIANHSEQFFVISGLLEEGNRS